MEASADQDHPAVFEADAHAGDGGEGLSSAPQRRIPQRRSGHCALAPRTSTTAETDARRLRCKNKAMLDAAIAESKKEAAKSRVARLVEEQIRVILAACSSSGGSSHYTPTPASGDDHKGKGPVSLQ